MLPKNLPPMLAVPVGQPFDSDQHLFEVKWDGIRCLVFVEGRGARLQSRESIDITLQFPELASLRQLPDGTIVDGELVVWDGERCSLGQIQRRVQLRNRHRIAFLSQSSPAIYIGFDLLFLGGRSIMNRSLMERRQELEAIFRGVATSRIMISQAVTGYGIALFDRVKEMGHEGIVAKSLTGPYQPGKRTALWKKIKVVGSLNRRRQDESARGLEPPRRAPQVA